MNKEKISILIGMILMKKINIMLFIVFIVILASYGTLVYTFFLSVFNGGEILVRTNQYKEQLVELIIICLTLPMVIISFIFWIQGKIIIKFI